MAYPVCDVSGWNELLIAGLSHRSLVVRDAIMLSSQVRVDRNSAHQMGIGAIFDRVLTELVAKMRDMKMDKTELGCLRSIVLFNPGEVTWHTSFYLRDCAYWSLNFGRTGKYFASIGRMNVLTTHMLITI